LIVRVDGVVCCGAGVADGFGRGAGEGETGRDEGAAAGARDGCSVAVAVAVAVARGAADPADGAGLATRGGAWPAGASGAAGDDAELGPAGSGTTPTGASPVTRRCPPGPDVLVE
jgi:hypothetical protein